MRQPPRKAGNYEVSVTLYRDGLDDAQWQEMTNPADSMRLLDENGHALRFNGVSEIDSGDKQMNASFQFDAGDNNSNVNDVEIRGHSDRSGLVKPARLVWQVPVETRGLVVPFEFNDLPLP